MFARRGRGGPSRSTPANVQCQKCLKRGHYSYECKAAAQERPYVSRPSRSQQLRNPKLVPKLTEATLDPVEDKKGVADQELAKREAERARKREIEDREDALVEADAKRRRSRSFSSESVSTISTNASRDSRSPRRRTRSPPGRQTASHSYDSEDDRRSVKREEDLSRSPSPIRHRYRSMSRDSRSLSPEPTKPTHRSRNDERYGGGAEKEEDDRPGQAPHADRSEVSPPRRRNYRDRSPPQGHSGGGQRLGRDRNQEQRGGRRDARRDVEHPRERSLSPFSKRLALTRGQNPADR